MKETYSTAYSNSKAGEEIEASYAVERSLDGWDHGRDTGEVALATCEKLRKAVGIMAGILVRSGLMTADELRQVVSYEFEVKGCTETRAAIAAATGKEDKANG
jgi:hypothetical protein